MAVCVVLSYDSVNHWQPSKVPIVCILRFYPVVSKKIFTDKNTYGDITNFDLEITSAIISNDVSDKTIISVNANLQQH